MACSQIENTNRIHKKQLQYTLPYVIENDADLKIEIQNFGKVYFGANEDKYWRKQNVRFFQKFVYANILRPLQNKKCPYTINYQARVTYNKLKFDVQICEGSTGPVFKITDLATREEVFADSGT